MILGWRAERSSSPERIAVGLILPSHQDTGVVGGATVRLVDVGGPQRTLLVALFEPQLALQ